MTYRELLNTLNLRVLELNNLNYNYSQITSKLRNELSKLQLFEEKQLNQLTELFVISLGKHEDPYKTSIAGFNDLLSRELTEQEKSVVLNRIKSFDEISIELETAQEQLEQTTIEFESVKQSKSDIDIQFEKVSPQSNYISKINNEVDKITNLLVLDELHTKDCEKIGFFGKVLVSKEMKMHLELKELKRIVSIIPELAVFNVFKQFDELSSKAKEMKSEQSDIEDKYHELRIKYSGIDSKLKSEIKLVKSLTNQRHYIADSISAPEIFVAIFNKLDKESQLKIWTRYGIDIESTRKNNEVREKFIRTKLEDAVSDFKKITKLLKKVEKQAERLSLVRKENLNKKVKNSFNLNNRQNKVSAFQKYYQNKYHWHTDNHKRYDDCDHCFDSFHSILIMMALDSNDSDNLIYSQSIFKELDEMLVSDVELLDIDFEFDDLDDMDSVFEIEDIIEENDIYQQIETLSSFNHNDYEQNERQNDSYTPSESYTPTETSSDTSSCCGGGD